MVVVDAVVGRRSALAAISAKNDKTDDPTEGEDALPLKSATSFGLQSLLFSTAC